MWENMSSVTIEDLPDPIIEYIFSYLSPYRDLKQCMLVSKAWQKHVCGVVRKIQRDFNNAISSMVVQWGHRIAEPGPTISKRYSHSACCCMNSMYIFGGCTTANTTFNDLWRLDLSSRCWIRPLATGTYPPPKACATLVSYEDNLVLFGGWTHTSPYPLHQVWRIFNHLHLYNTNSNRWTQVVTPTHSPAMAGHSATIHGDLMVVFGGIQKQNGDLQNGPSRLSVFFSSNDIWVLNLRTLYWQKQPTGSEQPMPRYGHSQIYLDEKHLLVMGGCGGPNNLFSDIWLLTMNDNPDQPWHWKEMDVKMKENAAPHLAFHPACKVGMQVVVMSKTQKSRTSPSALPHPLRAPSRLWVPPRGESDIMKVRNPQPMEVEQCVNGKRGVLKRQLQRRQQHSANLTSSSDEDDTQQSKDIAKKVASSNNGHNNNLNVCSSLSPPESSPYPSQQDSIQNSESGASGSVSPAPSTSGLKTEAGPLPNSDASNDNSSPSVCPSKDNADPHNSKQLSVRPNARRNRQRQLEGLDRMEQRLRDLRAGCLQQRFPLSVIFKNQKSPPPHLGSSRHPMCLYVLDISTAVTDGFVTWRALRNQCPTAPEEIILYSLVLGRGELIMFGGIQRDLNSRQQEGETVPEIVSNSLHFMSAQRVVI